MALTFYIKENDTSRSLKAYPRATPASDFTGATVVFNMREKGTETVKLSRAAAVIGSDSGGTYFQKAWSASDTDTPGKYEAEFEVTLLTGAVETYPSRGYISVVVGDDIA